MNCITWLLLGSVSFSPSAQAAPAKPTPAIDSSIELIIQDSSHIHQVIQRNRWFQQFRATALYKRSLSNLAPALFSVADSYLPTTETWKGKLLDYLYDKVLQGRPVGVAYYNNSTTNSPIVLTFAKLNRAETAVLKGLVKIFRQAEDQAFQQPLPAVTPIKVGGQNFVIVLQEGCFSFGKDPRLTAYQGSQCRKYTSSESILRIRLAKQFPTIAGIKDNFISSSDTAEFPLKFDTANFRFEPAAGVATFQNQLSPLLSTAPSEQIFRAMPADTFFYSLVNLPLPYGFDRESLQRYFSGDVKQLRKRPATSVALIYAPTASAQEGPSVGPALLLQYPGAKNAAKPLAQLVRSQESRAISVQAVCKDVIAISNRRAVMDALEKVCAGKSSSMADSRSPASLSRQPLSVALYYSGGKMLSQFSRMGWYLKNPASTPPVQAEADRLLLESLPSHLLSGAMEKNSVHMKAQ
jgi:hypothetical protein